MLLAAIPIGGDQDLLHFAVRELLVFGFFALVYLRSLGVIDWISRLFGSRPFYWLGELSYGTYLIHLLILQPLAAAVIGRFGTGLDRKSTRLLQSLMRISYAVFCLKKKHITH